MKITLLGPSNVLDDLDAPEHLWRVARQVASLHPQRTLPDSAAFSHSMAGRALVTMVWDDLYVRLIDVDDRQTINVSSSKKTIGGYYSGSGAVIPYRDIRDDAYAVRNELWHPGRFEPWPRR